MQDLRKTIRKLLQEAISLDVKPGDVILTGRFKNKRRIVKTIGTDKWGQPTINGKSILKFKIEKKMPKKKWSAKSKEELKETIRSMLLTESIHPKIEGMIQRFEETNTDEDPYEHLEISINIEDGDFIEVKLFKAGRKIGAIEAVKYNQRCLDAFEVTWAKGRLGLGPLLYDITMEVASQVGTGLMCDRSSVSEGAFDVWDKYLHMRCKVDRDGKCKSPDIEIMQLDNERFPITPQIEDDCRGQSSWNHYAANGDEDEEGEEDDGIDDQPYKDYWHSIDPLSKVYIKNDPAVIRRLLPFIKWKTGNLSTATPGWV